MEKTVDSARCQSQGKIFVVADEKQTSDGVPAPADGQASRSLALLMEELHPSELFEDGAQDFEWEVHQIVTRRCDKRRGT